MNHAEFFVHGTPVPQGSMKGFVVAGRARVTSDNTKLKPWREAVKSVAIDQDIPMTEQPLIVELEFRMPRPKSYPKRILFPWRKPDLDKLVRGVFDALTEASVWADDALVVSLFATKRFADEYNPMGVYVRIDELA
jgi:crossover junction endodeoxyribonuclease RusA